MRSSASVINICSGTADRGAARTAVCRTRKASGTMLTIVATAEFVTPGCPVRVNAMNPGAVACLAATDARFAHGASRHANGDDTD